jgi:hypothetical protein
VERVRPVGNAASSVAYVAWLVLNGYRSQPTTWPLSSKLGGRGPRTVIDDKTTACRHAALLNGAICANSTTFRLAGA